MSGSGMPRDCIEWARDKAIEYAEEQEMQMVSRESSEGEQGEDDRRRPEPAPISLVPTPFPRQMFDLAGKLGPLFSRLVEYCAQDSEFLDQSLQGVIAKDEFTSKLYDIYQAVCVRLEYGRVPQKARLGLLRSDYMVDSAGDADSLLQVELNTISVSFAGLSTQVSEFHRLLLEQNEDYQKQIGVQGNKLPENSAVEELVDGLAAGHTIYGEPDAVVLVVVQQGERNIYDQRAITQDLLDRHGVRTIRKTFAELKAEMRMDQSSGRLFVQDDEISVVYFRAGYTPTDYDDDGDAWDVRARIEASLAIKCPCIEYHLAGAKKIQQILAQEGVLERFSFDAEDIKLMRSSFAGLYSLSDDATLTQARDNPKQYVLKPQREGGGNNLYDDELRQAMQDFLDGKRNDRDAFILMQRILPAKNAGYFLIGGQVVKEEETLSELGIFSTILVDASTGEQLRNETRGHLLRTKPSTSNEGGVASGYAVIDSPLLI